MEMKPQKYHFYNLIILESLSSEVSAKCTNIGATRDIQDGSQVRIRAEEHHRERQETCKHLSVFLGRE